MKKAVPTNGVLGTQEFVTTAHHSAPAQICRTHQKPTTPDPTGEVAAYWLGVFRIMNNVLFGDQLPEPMITLEQKSGAHGYFRPDAFENLSGLRAHQIALNPVCFTIYGDVEAYQTLAHEMCHLWREEFGPRNKHGKTVTRGYHCRHWARKMDEIGLTPVSLDNPGKKTGFRVSDALVDDGPLDLVIREMLICGMRIDWRGPKTGNARMSGSVDQGAAAAQTIPSRKTRTKFTCQTCGLNAWAKASAEIDCHTCRAPMQRAEVSS